MNFANHTDEELLRHADVMQDPLTTTELERALLGRFEALLTENRVNAGMLEVLDEFNLETSLTADIEKVQDALQFAQDYDLKTVRALLDAALEFDIGTADSLKPMLEIADSICQARENPLEEGIALLHKIFNPTTTA